MWSEYPWGHSTQINFHSWSQDSHARDQTTHWQAEKELVGFFHWLCQRTTESDNKQLFKFTEPHILVFSAPFSHAWVPCGQIDLRNWIATLPITVKGTNNKFKLVDKQSQISSSNHKGNCCLLTAIQTLLILSYFRHTFRNMYADPAFRGRITERTDFRY